MAKAVYKNMENGQTGFGGFLALGAGPQGVSPIPAPSNGVDNKTYKVLMAWYASGTTTWTYLVYNETDSLLQVIT